MLRAGRRVNCERSRGSLARGIVVVFGSVRGEIDGAAWGDMDRIPGDAAVRDFRKKGNVFSRIEGWDGGVREPSVMRPLEKVARTDTVVARGE